MSGFTVCNTHWIAWRVSNYIYVQKKFLVWRPAHTEQPMHVPLNSSSLEIGWPYPNCLLGIVLASANFQTVPGSYSVECQVAWAKTMPDTSLLI